MSIWERITARARGNSARKSALYDLYPELTERVPVLRISSGPDDSADAYELGSTTGAESYSTNVWVHKAVRTVATSFSSLDLLVVKGNGRNRDVIENHPLYETLQKPNPAQGSDDFWGDWASELLLWGEVGAELVFGSSGSYTKLVEMWLRNSAEYAVRVESSRYLRARGYMIDDGNGPKYMLPPEEFLNSRFYNPKSKWRGMSPLAAARLGLSTDLRAQLSANRFYLNGSRPDYAVIAPEGMTRSEREEILNDVISRHQGTERSHLPIILEKGVTDIKTIDYPPKDLEWIEQRKLSREEIGSIFGVPDEIMGFGKDTYENFDTADRVLWTLTIVPLALFRDARLTQHLRQIKLLKPGEAIESNLSEVPQLQAYRNNRIGQLKELFLIGVPVSVGSAYLGLDLPAYEGDMLSIFDLQRMALPQPQGLRAWRGWSDKDGSKGKEKAVPPFGSEEHRQLWEARQKDLQPLVEDFQRKIKRYLQEQQLRVARRLRESRSFGRGLYKDPDRIPPLSELFDLEEEERLMIEALRERLNQAIETMGTAAIEAVLTGGLFDITLPEVLAGIREVLETVARKTNETTWNDLIEIFQQAESEGLGIPAMQERLSDYYGDRKSDWQTERIARTTMSGANNMATVEAWQQAGVVAGYSWLSALIPGRTREDHMVAHGQTRRLGEAFEVGGEYLRYPGDPAGSPGNIINCLCTLTPVMIEIEEL